MSTTDYLARQITSTVEDLDRDLATLIGRATALRAKLREGQRVTGGFGNLLGHEVDSAERAAASLDTLLSMAGPVGLSGDALMAAYMIE